MPSYTGPNCAPYVSSCFQLFQGVTLLFLQCTFVYIFSKPSSCAGIWHIHNMYTSADFSTDCFEWNENRTRAHLELQIGGFLFGVVFPFIMVWYIAQVRMGKGRKTYKKTHSTCQSHLQFDWNGWCRSSTNRSIKASTNFILYANRPTHNFFYYVKYLIWAQCKHLQIFETENYAAKGLIEQSHKCTPKGFAFNCVACFIEGHKPRNGRSKRDSIENDLIQSDDSQDNLIRNSVRGKVQ